MQGTALSGMGGDQCRDLSQQQIDKIRTDMAYETFEKYREIALDNGGTLNRDLTYQEAKDIHDKVFRDNGLSLDNWTLNTPMELIRQEYGDQAVEGMWEQIRDTGGDWADAANINFMLLIFMWGARNSQNPEARQKAEQWMEQFDWSKWAGIISDFVNANFTAALKTASPIVLDLDGDGIETYGAEGQVLFDHDGDGDKHGSGWVKSDDGLLVLDRNGNGTIDSGRELFGENTLSADGSEAKDGFEAMQDADSNADGKLDASDAVWADLRVWRDLNGDGISQSGELFTLQELGIESISTGSDGKTVNLGNNNHIEGFGTFQRDQAHGGGTGVAADVYFEENKFYREFDDMVEIPAELAGEPNMRGSGAVRDLREAAVGSQSLQSALTAYSQAGTRQEQQALLGQLISAWAATSGFRIFDERVADLAGDASYDVAFAYSWELHEMKLAAGGSGSGSGGGSLALGEGQEDDSPTTALLETKDLLEMVKVLEVFNNQNFFEFKPATSSKSGDLVSFSYSAGAQGLTGSGSLAFGTTYYLTEEDFSFGPQQEANIRAAYQALMDSVYSGLLLQTRLKTYLEEVSFALNENGVTLDYSGAIARVAQVNGNDPVKGIVDLIEFSSAMAGITGWASSHIELAGTWVRQLNSQQLDELKIQLGTGSSLVVDTVTDSTLQGGASSDFLFGEAGNDNLYGNDGVDFLDGGAGNDRLHGGNGNDILLGGEGNDSLYGGTGNDILEGGAGNDTLSGDADSDVYRFSRGWGQDTVNNNDSSTGKVDAIEFAADIAPSDILVTRSSNNLILSLAGSTDKITVSNYFNSDGASSYKLEEIRFADGTTWSIDKVKELALLSTAGNDTLTGYVTADQISGGAGNDRLYGENGNDLLLGGEGNDILYGGNGNDILEGGTGNDTLSGDAGSDVYRFSRGWGQDTINNNDSSTGKADAIEFAADIAPRDILVTRSSNSLILSLAGSTDKITVSSYFNSDGASSYKLEEIRFADGTTWSIDRVKELALLNTAGNETLTGYATADQISGGAGNDYLYGAAGDDRLSGDAGDDRLYGDDGNDILSGGEGNDYLYGGNGNDILEGGVGNDTLSGDAGSDLYRFSRGWGQDTVNNYDSKTGKVDAIEFAADIASSDILVTRSSNNLILSLAGSNDKITVSNYFNSDGASNYKLEEIRFADGATWSIDKVKELTLLGTAGNDTLTGYATADQISGGAGNDRLYGEDGNDLLLGGEGNDILYGGTGNDILEGGTGNDTLSGDAGSDVYRFSRGWGQDTVNNYDSSTGKVDAIEFAADIASSDILVTRSSNNLILSLAGSTDKVTVSNYFTSDGASYYKLEEIRFADGTVWSYAHIKAMTLFGTDHDDVLTDWDNLGELHGGAGNDTLDGGSGSNRLYGDAGDDVLKDSTSASNNLFVGGTGNDSLYGSYNSDTYVFNLGDGVDSIVETGSYTGAVDVLDFGEGIEAESIWLSRSGNDLKLQVLGTDDSVSIKNWYSSSSAQVEEIHVADGLALSASQVQNLVNAMASFGVPAGGEGNLTVGQRQQLDVVIAANWQ
jgi:Ca2+-binding RTX toxin-like protein